MAKDTRDKKAAGKDAVGAMGLTKKENRSRLSKLRSAAGKWVTHRMRFPSKCPMCKGSGHRLRKRGRAIIRIKCHQCVGKGQWISKKDYRAVYHDMRSPAFRAIPNIQDMLSKQYNQVRHGNPWPSRYKRYRMRDRELVDATHGIVWVLFDAARVPQATRWIWAKQSKGKKSAWFLWSPRIDGPWPTPGSGNEDETDGWQILTTSEWTRLRKTVAEARLTFRVVQSWRKGSVIRVRFEPRTMEGVPPLPQRVGRDAGRLAHSILTVHPDCSGIESEWMVEWHDSIERSERRVRWMATLLRSEFQSARWSKTSRSMWPRFLKWQDITHEGWTPDSPDAALGVPLPGAGGTPTPKEPTPPVEPSPAEPSPSEPTPAEPAPSKPAPTPPQPTPQEEPMENYEDELPEVTSKARNVAKGVLAKIDTEFEAASRAIREGREARQSGAHDVWQEKLEEAAMHIASIDDLWMEELVPAMPGGDEALRDAVANEHFGEFWDKVYEMKAMVRKLSVMK